MTVAALRTPPPRPSRPTGQRRYLMDISEEVEEAAEILSSGTTGGWMGSGARVLLLRAKAAADHPPPARLAGPRMGPQWLATCHVSPLGDTEKQSPRPRTHPHPRVPVACVADLIPFRARVPVRDSWVL